MKKGYDVMIDKRNGKRYPIARINGKWWTTRNASIALPGASYFPSPMHNPIGVNGLTYTWALAQQACPQGWRLPTSEELADLFLAYGKVGYAGDVPYLKEKFGPCQPDSTYVSYQTWSKDPTFPLPITFSMSDVVGSKIQRTLFWSSDSIGDCAYALCWDSQEGTVYFGAYPQSYFGFCRFVKIETPGKK